MKHDGGKGKKPYGNIDIGKIKYAIKSTLSAMSITFIKIRSNMAWPDPRWIGLVSASAAMWKPVSMHRLGEAIQCDLKALRMSKVDHAMSHQRTRLSQPPCNRLIRSGFFASTRRVTLR